MRNKIKVDEDKSGLKRLISFGWVYELIQFVAGANIYRTKMVSDYIRPFEGCKILDRGCGTGKYVKFLDKFCKRYEYYGFDSEANYIEKGKAVFKNRPEIHLRHQMLTTETIDEIGQFDIVIAIGVMHHMNDEVVLSLLHTAKAALKPGGRLITYDPGRFENEKMMETFFANYDRGRNIRSQENYAKLIVQVFSDFKGFEPMLTYYPSRNVVFECVK
jgi:SAM-dependent methyltransferase